MSQRQKRRRRVEILIDQRLMSFMKPIAAGPTLPAKQRDNLDFVASHNNETKPNIKQNKAS